MFELDSVKYDLNDLEQYGRRNSIRLNNYKPTMPARDEEELTKSVVYFLNESVLRDARPLQIRDIERCHFVGKAKAGRSKQIIIKFAHYHDKRRVFASKSNLKNNPSTTFMTEDPISKNHSMVKQLLNMKKGDKIDSFWTSDGRIYVKKEPTSDPIRVSMNDSISVKLELEGISEGSERSTEATGCVEPIAH